MQLVEVLVAATVFTAASGSSLQLFAQAASSSQQTELRQQRIERYRRFQQRLETEFQQRVCDLLLQSN